MLFPPIQSATMSQSAKQWTLGFELIQHLLYKGVLNSKQLQKPRQNKHLFSPWRKTWVAETKGYYTLDKCTRDYVFLINIKQNENIICFKDNNSNKQI